MKFHDICGNEHAKRAAEVALAGNHQIAFIGPADSDAWALALALDQAYKEVSDFRDTTLARTWQPCPCGYLRDGLRECTCSGRTISQWYYDHPFPQADIYVEVVRPGVDRLLKWAQHFTDGELHFSVMQRVLACRGRGMEGPFLFLDPAWNLLRNAANHLEMQPAHMRSVVDVAKTIARLAKSEWVDAAHMAEAIQYRPR